MQAPDPDPVPLDHLALRGARDAVALEDRDGRLDYAGLDALVGGAAGALRATGLAPGARVAGWLAKTRLACVLPLACARAGLVHVPVNPLLKRAQVAHILADGGAALLIAGAGRAETLAPGDRPEDCALLIEEDFAAGEKLPPSSADPRALVQLLYTSGSTGRPKGVMLSHANLVLGARSVAAYTRLAADDRVLAVLPLSFDAGQNQLLSAWAAGACAIPLDYLAPRDVVRAVERYGVTTITGVPPLWVQLAEATWPQATTLRRIANTGGRLGAPLVQRLRTLFPQADLYSMYGLTEAFRSTYLDPALIDVHPDSIGRAVPFAEVLVVRSDGSLAADDEPGELVHAGPLVAQGYWRDPERSAVRYRPAPAASTLGGVAVWSGDTVTRDAAGLLRFVGRVDEMIKVSGNRLSPTEVESAAVGSGATDEAVAIGVHDARLGQSVLLVVRGDAGREPALIAHLRATLPGYMIPSRIVWRGELPRGPNGKLDRAGLRQEFAA